MNDPRRPDAVSSRSPFCGEADDPQVAQIAAATPAIAVVVDARADQRFGAAGDAPRKAFAEQAFGWREADDINGGRTRLSSASFAASFANGVTQCALQLRTNLDEWSAADGADGARWGLLALTVSFVLPQLLAISVCHIFAPP